MQRQHYWFHPLNSFWLNGYFFAAGSEFGLVGGVFQAIIVAVINILIAFGIALFGIRQLSHARYVRRFVGIVSVLALIGWMLAYNFAIAHFRDQLALGAEDPMLQAITHFRLDPLGLKSVDSWLLVLLGVTFSVIAAADGYNFDDPYPGYGPVTRRWRQAREDYHQEKAELVDDQAVHRDATMTQLEACLGRIRVRN